MPVELLQFLISLEKGFLHGLFGIFRVLSYLLGNPEQLSIVSLHELLEGRNISASARLNQRRIVVWHVCLRRYTSVLCKRLFEVQDFSSSQEPEVRRWSNSL